MKAVILAAGYGSRLKAPVPKSLVRFKNGKCLLDYQLAALAPLIPLHDVFIVVGFKKELIMEAASSCNFLYNHRFDRTNTAKSLLLATQRIDDDLLWLNGDVYADPDVLEALTKTRGNVILADHAHVSDEEVCYTTNERGKIQYLAKQLDEAEGEALGINKMERASIPAFTQQLVEVDDHDYFERAIEVGIQKELFSFSPLEVPGKFVREMDFPADQEAIEDYLARNERQN